MSDDGIVSYGCAGFLRPLTTDIDKEAKRLKRRAGRLLHKAEIAERRGKRDRRDELLAQADECLLQANRLV